ncbi:RraA family protein [Cellulosimicrobium marinum]|uniref:RraA family protein n=1 Tax=Cellulosimicrobium marinum TaxID=1638992 RepID=UPI00226CEF58|nr:RraA family protein [Cellulosimicrobium marinum]MCB7135710.1 RraA family protein [Cellulosimicrobium marinum]
MADAAPDLVRRVDLPLVARNGRERLCGPAFPVVTDDDMLPCLQGLAACPPGAVLVIVNRVRPSEALVGDIFLTSAEIQGLAGVVVDGAVRDVEELRTIDVPVLSTEVTFASARTTDRKADEVPCATELGGTLVTSEDWIFADPDGVAVVHGSTVRAVLVAAGVLRQREDGLRDAIRSRGQSLAELTSLDGFLEGTGALGYVP